MKSKRFLATLMAAVFALCVAGLAGCGSSEPQVSDEELIKQDCEQVIGTYISADEMLDALRDDESLSQLEEYGLDIEAYATNMANIFKFEVTDVEVDGDTAVAKGSLTVPDYSDAMDTRIDEAIEKATESVDVSALSEDEVTTLLMGVINEVLSDPDFPTTSTKIDIDYVKDGNSWTMKDAASIEQDLSDIATAAAGL